MNESEIFNKICLLLDRSLKCHREYVAEERLADIPGWSSIIYIFTITAVEEEFHISLPIDNLFEISTVGDLSELVSKELSQKK